MKSLSIFYSTRSFVYPLTLLLMPMLLASGVYADIKNEDIVYDLSPGYFDSDISAGGVKAEPNHFFFGG